MNAAPDPQSPEKLKPLDMTHLEYLWFHSDCETLTEFAKSRGLEPKPFLRRARGWKARRDILRRKREGTGPNGVQARARLLDLWWRVLEDLSTSLEPGCDEARLKALSTAAGILKAAHAGVGNLVNLSEESALTPIVIEGLHVDQL